MSYEFEKHFTLEQANALIPYIRQLFSEVRSLLSQAPAAPDATGHYDISRSDSSHEHGNGNGRSHEAGNGNGTGKKSPTASADYAGWSEEKRHEAAYRLLNALQAQGIVIQDVERGLIDFPSIRERREVFLCYELNDGDCIGYFHDIDAGYAGRKQITEISNE